MYQRRIICKAVKKQAVKKQEIDKRKKKNMNRISKAVFICMIVLASYSLTCQPGVDGLSLLGNWYRVRLQCPQCFKVIQLKMVRMKMMKMKKQAAVNNERRKERRDYPRVPRIG